MVRYEKTMSNLKEVKARSGIVIALATEGDKEIARKPIMCSSFRQLPKNYRDSRDCPLQLLAYHIAVRRGCDVDQREIWPNR